MFQFTKQACSEWRRIGRELGFKENELITITREGARTTQEDYYAAMLISWLDWAPPNHPTPTVERLSTALRKAGKESLASEFETYCGCITSTAISNTDSSANALLYDGQGQGRPEICQLLELFMNCYVCHYEQNESKCHLHLQLVLEWYRLIHVSTHTCKHLLTMLCICQCLSLIY